MSTTFFVSDLHLGHRRVSELRGHTHRCEIRREGPREIHVELDAWELKPVPLDAIEQIIANASPR